RLTRRELCPRAREVDLDLLNLSVEGRPLEFQRRTSQRVARRVDLALKNPPLRAQPGQLLSIVDDLLLEDADRGDRSWQGRRRRRCGDDRRLHYRLRLGGGWYRHD